MITISANELKTKGISVLQGVLDKESEAVITVRGQQRYVVMDMNHYETLREAELETALLEARRDVEKGSYVVESVRKHIKRVTR